MTKWLAMAAMLMACGANAADWVSVGTEGDIEHFVDAGSLARSGEIVRLTKRAVFREPHPMGDTPGMPLMKETVGVVEDDCKRFQHRVVSLQLLGVDGKVLWDSGTMKRVWEAVDAGTPGRATLDFVCSKTAK
jgi:hypothetical protein